MSSPIVVVRAPSNLGLRPLREGHVPGAWRAPEALTRAGLIEGLEPRRVIDLERPPYQVAPQQGTRLRNGLTMRAFNLQLANAVHAVLEQSLFALVIGGDCSVLLGALAGARRLGPLSLVHIDGHSDFRHPGNYDPSTGLGSVAGMDLALATGRGEGLMTTWPGAPAPLVADEHVIQIGERNGQNPQFPWSDIYSTQITTVDIFRVREIKAAGVVAEVRQVLGRVDWPFWIHLDVDVLDAEIMPAVDSPGSPGFDVDQLVATLQELTADRRCLGMTYAIFDPDLDPEGAYAVLLAELLKSGLRGRLQE